MNEGWLRAAFLQVKPNQFLFGADVVSLLFDLVLEFTEEFTKTLCTPIVFKNADLHFLPQRGIGGQELLCSTQIGDCLFYLVLFRPQVGALNKDITGELWIFLGEVEYAVEDLVGAIVELVPMVVAGQPPQRRDVILILEDFIPRLLRVLTIFVEHECFAEKQASVKDVINHWRGLDRFDEMHLR